MINHYCCIFTQDDFIKQGWTNETLEEDKKELFRLFSSCITPEDKYLLDFSNNNINFLLGSCISFKTTFEDIKTKYDFSVLDNFYSKLSSSNKMKLLRMQYSKYKAKLNTKDIFCDVAEFYKNFDPELYEVVNNIYNKKDILFRVAFPGFGSSCHSIPSLEKSYITLDDLNSNVKSLSILTHETEHAVQCKMNKYNCLEKNFNYLEIDTLFIEMALLDYLCNFNKEDYLNLKAYYLNLFKNRFNDCKFCLEHENMTYKISNKKAVFRVTSFQSLPHMFAFPYSVEFYELYRKDKKEGLKMLKNFIVASDKAEFIKSNNIEPGKSLTLFNSRAN